MIVYLDTSAALRVLVTGPGRGAAAITRRTLDAIHLAVAVRVGADLLVAYNEDLCRAAQSAGLRTGPE